VDEGGRSADTDLGGAGGAEHDVRSTFLTTVEMVDAVNVAVVDYLNARGVGWWIP
jgi:hypothetical protein